MMSKMTETVAGARDSRIFALPDCDDERMGTSEWSLPSGIRLTPFVCQSPASLLGLSNFPEILSGSFTLFECFRAERKGQEIIQKL